MATEKQASYIRNLIDQRRTENMEWWNEEITGASSEDIEMGIRYDQINKKAFIISALNISRREARKLGFESAVERYQNRIAELDALDLDTVNTIDASKLIDELKAFFH